MEMELVIYGPPELITQMNDACRYAGELIGCGFVLADYDMFTLWVASQSYPFYRATFCINIDFLF
jgi:hypothetical protein